MFMMCVARVCVFRVWKLGLSISAVPVALAGVVVAPVAIVVATSVSCVVVTSVVACVPSALASSITARAPARRECVPF